MRHLTDISNKQHAESLVAYLLTQGISTHVDVTPNDQASGSELWSVWIREETRIPEAKTILDQFQSNPNDPRFAEAISGARSILQQKRAEQKERIKNIHNVRAPRSGTTGGKMPPITFALIIVCVAFALGTNFSRPNSEMGATVMNKMMFVERSLYLETADPAASIKRFEIWRIFTPAFLHGGPFHLLLNMLSLASLGRLTEKLEGRGKYILILLLCAMGAHLLQGLLPPQFWGSPNFVGISGVVIGLFGYLAVKSRIQPNCGFFFPPDAYLMTGMLLLIGFLSPNGMGLANMAHLGGLATGAVLGFLWNR